MRFELRPCLPATGLESTTTFACHNLVPASVTPVIPSLSFDASHELLGEKDPVPLLAGDFPQDVRIDKLVDVLLSGTPSNTKEFRRSCCRHGRIEEEIIDQLVNAEGDLEG